MKKHKLKNEAALVKEAVRVGMIYFKKRGAGEIEESDAQAIKIRAIYRLLVFDKLIQPLAKGEDNDTNMRHKLALWIAKTLPSDHPLLQEPA